jgi:hypothetical protein
MLNVKKINFFGFIFILILSLIPRIIMLFTRRLVSFGSEQGMDFLVTKDILVKHIFPLTKIDPLLIWHMLPRIPGWYYLLNIPFVLGGGNPLWAKAMTGLISMITILFIFFVAKSAFNLKTAIATCVLLSISPWLIEQTGQIWPPYVIILPIAIYLFATIKFLKKKQNYVILMALSIGLMVQFEIVTAFLFLAQTLLIVPLAIKYKYISLKTLVLSILALFMVLLPNILYDLTHKFYSAGGFSILTNDLVKGGSNNIISLLGQRIDVFTWNFRSTFSPNIFKSIFLFLIMYGGVYAFIKNKNIAYSKKLFVAYLALIPFIKFFILLFYPGGVQAWDLLDLTVIYCFLLGIILGYFLNRPVLKMLSLAILAGLILISVTRMNEIFRNEFQLSYGVDRIAQASSVEYIFQNAHKQQFNYISLDKNQQRYDFDYLFWWYGAMKYGYQPSVNKQKLNYYILDKNDANHESLPKNLTGTVIDTKDFQNGFSVIKVID